MPVDSRHRRAPDPAVGGRGDQPRTSTPAHSACHKHPAVLRILQLNLNGWKRRKLILEKTLADWEVDIALCQESNLTADDETPKMRGFAVYRHDRQIHRGERASPHGGLLTLVREGIKHLQPSTSLPGLPQGSALEVQTTTIHQSRSPEVRLLNVYRPPGRNAADDQRDTELHLEHWPTDESSLIFGDLNCHGSWDPHVDSDGRGDEVEGWAADHNWCYLNDGTRTRTAPNGTVSAPDVTLVHGRWTARASWWVGPTVGSDHLPIIVDLQLQEPIQRQTRGPARYSFRKAHWGKFQEAATRQLQGWSADTHHSLEAANKDFCHRVLLAANVIPRGSLPRPKSWWSDRCRAAKTDLRRAEAHLEQHPGDPEAVRQRRTTRETAGRTFLEEKERAWQQFAATLDTSTPTSKVWEVVRSLDGRGRSTPPDTPLESGAKVAYSDRGKANVAMETYASVSRVAISRADSKAAYTSTRDYLRHNPHDDQDTRSSEFSMVELERVLSGTGGKASGPDGIHPLLLRKLSEPGRHALLSLVNRSWREGRLPASWRRADIIPILKKSKPADQVKSYRPVSLLSCVGKVAESLVAKRLEHWAESGNHLPDLQSGFRKGRSTTDALALIVQRAFDGLNTQKKMTRTLVVTVDIQAAFDGVWRGGLLKFLADRGIPARWLRWIRAFFRDRRARVRWNNTYGTWKILKEGVPQGSPLSPLLFILATAPLSDAIQEAAPEVVAPGFADDLTITTQDKEPATLAVAAQRALDAASAWCKESYTTISSTKTEALVITTHPREVNAKLQPRLLVDGQQVTYNRSPTILGLTLDSQLTFTTHAAQAASKMKRRCSILRAVAARNWGANTTTLRHLYCSFVRPAGLYAAGIWWPFTSPTTRKSLESVNLLAARTITGVGAGARGTTTCMDAGLPPLDLLARRDAAKIMLHLQRHPAGHPLSGLLEPPARPTRLKARSLGGTRPCWRSTASALLREAGLSDTPTQKMRPPEAVPPPWDWELPIRFRAVPGTSRDDNPLVRQALALEFLDHLRTSTPPDMEVWTDGAAVDGVKNGGGGYVIKWPAPDQVTTGSVAAGTIVSSTYAEAAAVAAALKVAWDELLGSEGLHIWVVFDSMALHERLRNPRRSTLDPATAEASRHLHLLAQHHSVTVIWVPGHAGLPLNVQADEAARAGTLLPQPATARSSRAATQQLNRYVEKVAWRNNYLDDVPPDNLHRRCSEGFPLPLDSSRTRAEDLALYRLRANRAPFLRDTQFRWQRVDDPKCPHCPAAVEDTEHFILECPRWAEDRTDCLGPSPTISVLQDSVSGVLSFLRRTGVLA